MTKSLKNFKIGIAGVMAVFAVLLTLAVSAVFTQHDLTHTHTIFTGVYAKVHVLLATHDPFIALGLIGLFGTTIIQTWPIAGTFPTSQQAVSFNTQTSRVVFADADTVAVLTHNWGISAAQLAAFFPLIDFYAQNAGTAGTTLPQLTFALTDSNTVTINKTAATGSGGTYVVTLQRPWSATE